jgi:opacity protein-like surface antigen
VNCTSYRHFVPKRSTAGLCSALLFGLAFIYSSAFGQSVPDAYKDNPSLWAGIEFANIEAGFPYGSSVRLSGLGGIASFNWTHHLLLEAQARVLNLNRWNGESEHDYFAGPRYTFLKGNRLRPFARFEVGEVTINYPFNIGVGHQFAMVPAGGVECRLKHRWSVRGTYEYQILPNSPNFTDEPHFGMRPNGVFAGVTYRVF